MVLLQSSIHLSEFNRSFRQFKNESAHSTLNPIQSSEPFYLKVLHSRDLTKDPLRQEPLLGIS